MPRTGRKQVKSRSGTANMLREMVHSGIHMDTDEYLVSNHTVFLSCVLTRGALQIVRGIRRRDLPDEVLLKITAVTIAANRYGQTCRSHERYYLVLPAISTADCAQCKRSRGAR